MNTPSELLYTKSHEWVKMLDGGKAKVGITDFAQDALGDLVFVNLPCEGDATVAGEVFADVESVKAVSDIFCPVTGTVEEVNNDIVDAPELINNDAYAAWFAVIGDVSDKTELLTAAEYEAFCAEEE